MNKNPIEALPDFIIADALQKLKHRLRGTGYFAFGKGGKYFLYRETPPKNTLVIEATAFTRFLKRVQRATGVKVEINSCAQ